MRHAANGVFARAHITGRDGWTEVTGPIPWRRWTRGGEVLAFVMLVTRYPGHFRYVGRHRAPCHARPEGSTRFPDGMVYVGHWTRHVYRMEPRGTMATKLLRQRTPWLDGQHRHRRLIADTGVWAAP